MRQLIAAVLLLLPLPAFPEIKLREVSAEWGLDFRHHHGGSGERYMVETMVGGVVILDFDGDGDQDVLFVDGGSLPGYQGEEPRTRLYRNDGAARFVDVTDRSGLTLDVYGCGGTAGDVDNDGDLDLYVTAFGPNRLFRNSGDGTFVEVSAEAGVADPLWTSSAAFADVDADGDLDLYNANYVDFRLDNHHFCGDKVLGLRGYCNPDSYNGEPDRFFRNRGDGTFEDATAAAGFGTARGAALGLVFGDLDNDGRVDLYVANDSDPNYLFRNRGDGTFEDISLLAGIGYSDTGSPEAGMGVDLGDVDGNGFLDVVVTNFELETNALYKNSGMGVFIDDRFGARIAEPSLLYLAFGVVFGDLDHDGDLDLVIANGHILDNAEAFNPNSRYAQENQVLENVGQGRFQLAAGAGLEVVRVSRGLSHGDLDNDGDLDLAFSNAGDLAEVYENLVDRSTSGWLQVDLAGGEGNRHGIGARVELVANGARQLREVRTGSSFQSQSALTVHFGLGAEKRIERLEIRWPRGTRQRFEDLPAGRRLLISGR